MAKNPDSYDLLRQYMSPAVRGKMTDAFLGGLAAGDDVVQANALAAAAQRFISTAGGKYLDTRAGNVGFVRPPGVGLQDDTFRQLAIATTANKQINSALLGVLEVFYGPESTRASLTSAAAEPYALRDGDTLYILLDERTEVVVVFRSSDFGNIAAAKASEVAFSVARQARTYAPQAIALEQVDPGTGLRYVQMFSGALGSTSSMRVTGGRAQNVLRFPKPAGTTQTASAPATQWTVQVQPSGDARLVWQAGTDPSLQFASVGDYVNLFGAPLLPQNRGSFPIKSASPGPVGSTYVEFNNPAASSQTFTMATDDDVVFWTPLKTTPLSTGRYAVTFEADPDTVLAFLPATTTVTEREPTQAAYPQLDSHADDYLGPYVYDPAAQFVLSSVSTALAQSVDEGQAYTVIHVADASQFPDDAGYLVFAFGTARQEGPIRYLARPGSALLLEDPSYRFQHTLLPTDDVTLLSRRGPAVLDPSGGSFQFYATGTAAGRLYAEDLLRAITAAGVDLVADVIYPGDVGLGNAGLPKTGARVSEAVAVWGGDPP